LTAWTEMPEDSRLLQKNRMAHSIGRLGRRSRAHTTCHTRSRSDLPTKKGKAGRNSARGTDARTERPGQPEKGRVKEGLFLCKAAEVKEPRYTEMVGRTAEVRSLRPEKKARVLGIVFKTSVKRLKEMEADPHISSRAGRGKHLAQYKQ